MHSFLIGLQFLTRLKLEKQTVWTAQDFGRSVKFFPLVGLVVGLVWAVVYYVGRHFLPSYVLAAVLVVSHLVITGGLHVDGFMDTADGIFSGRSRERMLEIMKDSRVGANGVMAFGVLLLLKWSLLLDMPGWHLPEALVIAPMVGRMAMVIGIIKFPYARPEGIGKAFAEHAEKRSLYIATAYTAITVAAVGLTAVYAALAAVAVAWAFARYITRLLGGLTGDVYGAITELAELCVLFMFVLLA